MEELVGRAVKKAFRGFGVYSGVVGSYDAEARYFRVLYKDGDSEEVDLGKMPAILVGPPMRRKKRRCGDEEFPQANGVVVMVEAAAGDGLSNGDGPVTPAERSRDEANGEVMAETVEKKRRVNPEPESATLLRRSARQTKAAALVADMEAAAAAAAAEATEAVSVRRLRLRLRLQRLWPRLLLHRSSPGGNIGEEAPKGLTGSWRSAWDLFKEMEGNVIQPDANISSSFMEALNKGSQPERVLQLMKFMKENRILLNQKAYFEIIASCSMLWDWKTTSEIIEHFDSSLSSISVGTLNHLLNFLGKCGKTDSMMKLFYKMVTSCSTVGLSTYTVLLRNLLAVGKWRRYIIEVLTPDYGWLNNQWLAWHLNKIANPDS